VPTAVVYPCEAHALTGPVDAWNKKLIVPILVGPASKIAATAKSAGVDLGGLEIVDVPDSHSAAEKSVELIHESRAEVLMKGSLHTDVLMSVVVSREGGLRTDRRISHAFLMDVPTYHKVLIVTDGAINIAPVL
jgi:phosphotransacetylase